MQKHAFNKKGLLMFLKSFVMFSKELKEFQMIMKKSRLSIIKPKMGKLVVNYLCGAFRLFTTDEVSFR